jgi:CubicO group peptidase (beta-lactamase class C family)
MASVTKSVMTTLIGIAAGQGKLDLEQPILSFFPGRTIANLDERKERINVRHLTGMVNGLESGCLEGDRPTIAAMMAQPDWVQAALDRKWSRSLAPSFCYDSPNAPAVGHPASRHRMTAGFRPAIPVRAAGIRRRIWIATHRVTRAVSDLH